MKISKKKQKNGDFELNALRNKTNQWLVDTATIVTIDADEQ
jgi:hypothetical protein